MFNNFIAVQKSSQDYYPFGMIMPGRNVSSSDGYRFGFNGQERDDEIKGLANSLNFGARIYDPRVARFFSVDALSYKVPGWTPYRHAADNPILFLDKDGNFEITAQLLSQFPRVALLVENFNNLVNRQQLPPGLARSLNGVNLDEIFNDKLIPSMIKNSTLQSQTLQEVFTSNLGPIIQSIELDNRSENYLVDGRNELDWNDNGEAVANKNRSDQPGDGKGLISIDNDLYEVLEFELGGVPGETANAIGFGNKKQSNEGLQRALSVFSKTLLHETTHYGRNRTGAGNKGGVGSTEFGFKMEGEVWGPTEKRYTKDEIKDNYDR